VMAVDSIRDLMAVSGALLWYESECTLQIS